MFDLFQKFYSELERNTHSTILGLVAIPESKPPKQPKIPSSMTYEDFTYFRDDLRCVSNIGVPPP